MKSVLSLILCLSLLFAQVKAQVLKGKYLYSHYNPSANSDPDSIYTLGSDGVTQTFITLGIWPRLSHSGKYLAFSKGPNPNSVLGANLWLRDLQTKTENSIISNSDYLNYYDFSPTEQKIIYAQYCSIFTTNLDGSSIKLVRLVNCYDDNPSLRMSDSMVVFHNLYIGLGIMKFDGTNAMQIPNTVPGDWYASWSKDGTAIVFLRKGTLATVGYNNAIAKIKPDGSGLTTLLSLSTTDTITANPVFTTDMTKVSFIARIGGVLGLYEVTADGSGVYSLVHPFSSPSVANYFLGVNDTLVSLSSLPLTLLQFEAKSSQNSGVILTWKTANEINTARFDVQRSEDGNNFTAIGSVLAKAGSAESYSYNDQMNPFLNGTVYYRLKMIDKNGSFSFSRVVSVQLRSNFTVTIFPNPIKGEFTVDLKSRCAKAEFSLLDASGQQVYHAVYYNTTSQKITPPAGKGVYALRVVTEKGVVAQKIVVL